MSSRPSSRSGGGAERQYQQDFITRIRYQNALPPPPNPPKLLDIPNNAAAEYTSTKFVSRLAREQPLNIEVDSELGMPLDLLPFGPQIFSLDGRVANAALFPAERAPKIDEKDKPLLRSAAILGKPSKNISGVSFLRRTEYISSESARSTFKSTTSKDLVQRAARLAGRASKDPKNDPVVILKDVIDGFDVAHPKSGKWEYPIHPSKPHLRPVESFPVLPDFDAQPDGKGYVIIKLSTNPVHATTVRNIGLDYALLRPWNGDGPEEEIKFDYFLPETSEDAKCVKRKYENVDTSDQGYSTHNSDGSHDHVRYKRIRAYEYNSKPQDRADPYGEDVILALHDGASGERPKAAYFSPISNRYSLRPMRPTKMVMEQEDKTDIWEVRYRALNELEESRIETEKRILQGKITDKDIL